MSDDKRVTTGCGYGIMLTAVGQMHLTLVFICAGHLSIRINHLFTVRYVGGGIVKCNRGESLKVSFLDLIVFVIFKMEKNKFLEFIALF